ncbi:MAG: hypothetical protein IK115_01690 [Lachnospiraceae bacterium]|nr:hypothetical protein [Lachnospiraceae bacterium]
MKRIIYAIFTLGIICLPLASCNSAGNVNETGCDEADLNTIEWKDDPTIGKMQAGYYKRISIVKKDETYEEMLKLRDVENKGYLIVYDDGTASFELDGEKTEYFYDEYNLYSDEDTEKTNGIPYVYIGGRLLVDDGETITQYLKLSDEELE